MVITDAYARAWALKIPFCLLPALLGAAINGAVPLIFAILQDHILVIDEPFNIEK